MQLGRTLVIHFAFHALHLTPTGWVPHQSHWLLARYVLGGQRPSKAPFKLRHLGFYPLASFDCFDADVQVRWRTCGSDCDDGADDGLKMTVALAR